MLIGWGSLQPTMSAPNYYSSIARWCTLPLCQWPTTDSQLAIMYCTLLASVIATMHDGLTITDMLIYYYSQGVYCLVSAWPRSSRRFSPSSVGSASTWSWFPCPVVYFWAATGETTASRGMVYRVIDSRLKCIAWAWFVWPKPARADKRESFILRSSKVQHYSMLGGDLYRSGVPIS